MATAKGTKKIKEVKDEVAQSTESTPVAKVSKARKTARTGSESFAVIMTGGKQYQVRVGDELKIEKILGEHAVGEKLSFDEVLLVDNAGVTTVGAPHVKGASVKAEITEIGRDPKVTVVHYKQKSKYFKKYGHRQPFFKVSITSIAA